MLCPRRLAVAWACGLLAVGAAPGFAEVWGSLETPVAGSTVHAGDVVQVRWASLPGGLDEFELLLSVDAGRSYPIRLTPQLDPGLRSLSWRVPNLSAPRARLRLRVGIDGDEVEGPPGPEFTIVASTKEPTSGLELRAGEWWVVPAPLAAPGPERPPARVGGPHPGARETVVACSASKPSASPPSAASCDVLVASALHQARVGRRDGLRPSPQVRLRP